MRQKVVRLFSPKEKQIISLTTGIQELHNFCERATLNKKKNEWLLLVKMLSPQTVLLCIFLLIFILLSTIPEILQCL